MTSLASDILLLEVRCLCTVVESGMLASRCLETILLNENDFFVFNKFRFLTSVFPVKLVSGKEGLTMVKHVHALPALLLQR